jgi:cysteine synthase A
MNIPMTIHNYILESIGNTPLMRLELSLGNRIYCIYAKLEFLNPTGSIKDRIAKHIIEQAEATGELRKGHTIVEATSGNTGIALSMVAATKGYKMLVVMPEHMTHERVKMMENLGASVCLTPKEDGFEGAVAKADYISRKKDEFFLANQFRNPNNTRAHYCTTGKEIVRQMSSRIDAFVAGVGTGGTLMGVGQALKEQNDKVILVAVEPEEAAVMSGKSKICDHKIAGIGDGFVPDLVDKARIDEIVTIKSDDAVEMARKLSMEKGLMVGISSGANVLAAIKILDKIGLDKTVVTVLPDRPERYFSTDLYNKTEARVRRCRRCECPF